MSDTLLGGALRRVVNRQLKTNTYLLAAPGATAPGSDCVVVDAGMDHGALDAALAACGWQPRAVLCTHGHFDHIGGAARLQQAHGIPVYVDGADLKTAKQANFLLAAFKRPERITLPEFTALNTREAAQSVEAAGRRFAFHALPGHTPGGCAIVADGLLFSGDSLYARHTALSRLPGENHAVLRASLLGLFAWADGHALVLPGHGESATLDDIRAHNDALRRFLDGAAHEGRGVDGWGDAEHREAIEPAATRALA